MIAIETMPLSCSWLCLSKHVHNDHVARLVVHHEVEHVSSNLIGGEIHCVIAGVELISVILHSVCIGLNYLVEARRPSNGRIGDQLYPGSDGAYYILCPACCSLDPEVIGPGWHCGYILGVWQRLAGAVVYPGWRPMSYIELGRCADYPANYRHT